MPTNATRHQQHITQELTAQIQSRIGELQAQLHLHYSNLAQLYAFACGEKTLRQKKRYTQQAHNYQRKPEDEKRLRWTVNHLQSQITQLQQELFQLLGASYESR